MHVCSCLFVAVGVFSFSQFRLAETRMSMVSSKRPHSLHLGPSSGFQRMLCWYQLARRLWSWAAMRPAAFSHLMVLLFVNVSLFHPLWVFAVEGFWFPLLAWAVGDRGVWLWPLFFGHRWCSPYPLQVVLRALPVPDWTSLTVCWWSTRISCSHDLSQSGAGPSYFHRWVV